MQRRAGVILLLAGVLMSGQGVFAADGKTRHGHADHAEKSVTHTTRTNDYDRKAAGRSEKKMMSVAQADGLRDVAMHFPDREGPLQNPWREQSIGQEEAGAGSGFAMLIAGLGVALISIVRRMGSIQ